MNEDRNPTTAERRTRTRGLCPYLVLEETPSIDGPFNPIPRCSHLRRLREEDPALDAQLGPMDSCCVVACCPGQDFTASPWCATGYTYAELQLEGLRDLQGKYPGVGRHRCEICGLPIVFEGDWGQDGHHLCSKCERVTFEARLRPVSLLGPVDASVTPVYTGEDLERMR